MVIEGPDPLFEELAALIAEMFGAELAHLEVLMFGEADPTRLWGAHGRPNIERVRGLARAARQDSRTAASDDGKQVCIPIPQGHAYLEREHAFDAAEIERIAHLVGRLERLIARITPPPGAMSLSDQVRRLKQQRVYEALQRHEWSVVRAARELRVARSYVYRVVASVRRQRRRAATLCCA
ncbi:MAG: hypothetical protein KF773_23435 [Deltaproteobacteria bacterium]|nr:hypothetical protein [Deltaproteobacteria bacterium]MCW5809193.1 hypothetical protein [Deltaproteobacteria bacterium]